MTERAVEIFVALAGREVLAGRLWAHRGRGSESQTFSYDEGYLQTEGAYELDPLLSLHSGQQQTPVNHKMFGAFADCAPDRWGRRLIARTERKRVQREGGAPRSFGETDYLLGVRDDLRQGALRFRDPDTHQFLAPERGVPSLLELPRLLSAAEHLERDEESEEELATLLRGGSSLGGARPKAHVVDENGRIAIAKFPSPTADEWDVIRWEAVAMALAAKAGITVSSRKLHTIDEKPVLVVDRFDRNGDRRLGYVSALTMLERSNGDRGSYLEVAEVLTQQSPRAVEDLWELWTRIAFSVLISNFDDHLRNHGFLRTSTAGWSLSPAFDLNPDPRPGHRHLTTAIDLDDTEARIDLIMEVREEFRLSEDQALKSLTRIVQATSSWRDVAAGFGVSGDELELMEPAFEHEAADVARELALASSH